MQRQLQLTFAMLERYWIYPGCLLTSPESKHVWCILLGYIANQRSCTTGHLQVAIKALDQSRAFGAGIIKARGPLGPVGPLACGNSLQHLQLDFDLGTALGFGCCTLYKNMKNKSRWSGSEAAVKRLASRLRDWDDWVMGSCLARAASAWEAAPATRRDSGSGKGVSQLQDVWPWEWLIDVDRRSGWCWLMLIWCWLMVEIGWDGDGTQDKSWGDKWDEAGSGESPSPERLRDSQDRRRDDSGRHRSRGQGLPAIHSPSNYWDLSCSHQILIVIHASAAMFGTYLPVAMLKQKKCLFGSLDWPRDSSQGLRAMKRSKQKMKLHCGAWHITPVSPIPQFLLVASPSTATRPVTRGKWWFNVNLLHPFTIFFSYLFLANTRYRLYI